MSKINQDIRVFQDEFELIMPSVQKGKLIVLLSLVIILLYAPILFLVLMACVIVSGLVTFIFNICWESRDRKLEASKKALFSYENGSHAIERDDLSPTCEQFAKLNYQVEWLGKFNAFKFLLALQYLLILSFFMIFSLFGECWMLV